ncbi:uncharacterized protein Z518_07719 [Rhinocladiella mackenziei CBS 650.93]|uniref:von Willebrand domain-containing protein n=1 Tax=Rhinocladiella mackenziei CBS 650.93 TaxID=1442369 RepID=A0A0D2J576_9EURO|nr:uncharacterized protein Z518_07719 [Rhinocladiella mackenziei CBS 650.93]KIX04165.1 hypothetical protein Z518_07719 [Rhinocladiella mackenziei CBS 650.93]
MSYYPYPYNFCGCWFPVQNAVNYTVERRYLRQVELSSSTNILATTSRTTLKQTFVNTEEKKLEEVQYTFPLYDGVSVVSFTCTVGPKTIVGVVKEKQQAREEYQEAVSRGETAGLLEQLPEASDVFTTSIGNVPPREEVHVEIVYLGELKHDAETDGSRFTVPTIIAPRYGSVSSDSADRLSSTNAVNKGGISILVDVTLEEGSIVRGLQSPSHPIAVTMGRTSAMNEDAFNNNHASATLTLGTTELDKDFIIVVLAKGNEIPRALLETHPNIPNQRAIMTTLIPKFNIPNISPEVVFVVDRSGSMNGKMELVVSAMKIFLKSLPVGVKFNICSFGSRYSFLFKKSKTYDQSSLKEALKHLDTFSANYGGTEMLNPVKETVKSRYKDLPLEVMLLTDGEIWNQNELFSFVNETKNARFFTLGIGHGASSALVEGIARAGNGFSQFVGENEKMEKRVVRMLKGALTPHVTDYTIRVTYGEEEPTPGDDDFEIVDDVEETTEEVVTDLKKPEGKKPISLFDANASEEPTNPPAGRYDNLPTIPVPKVLQAPHQIPALFPFNRTTVYLLLGSEAPRRTPKSVTLRGTSEHGPLELEIPVQDVGLGETIHQLAAKKAVHELEQGRGWLTEARNRQNKPLKSAHEGKWDLIVEREAVRLGVLFQIGGKWCSFVAVEKNAPGDDETLPAYSQTAGQGADFAGGSEPHLGSSKSSSALGSTTAAPFPPCGKSQGWQNFLFASKTQVNCRHVNSFGSVQSTGGGLFGNTNKAASTGQSGGLFSGGGLFGNNFPHQITAPPKEVFGTTPASGGTKHSGALFGSSSTSTMNGAGCALFGTSASGFGPKSGASSSRLFGDSAASCFGSGNTSHSTADPATQSFGFFGTSSLFGHSSPLGARSPAGGLFGNASASVSSASDAEPNASNAPNPERALVCLQPSSSEESPSSPFSDYPADSALAGELHCVTPPGGRRGGFGSAPRPMLAQPAPSPVPAQALGMSYGPALGAAPRQQMMAQSLNCSLDAVAPQPRLAARRRRSPMSTMFAAMSPKAESEKLKKGPAMSRLGFAAPLAKRLAPSSKRADFPQSDVDGDDDAIAFSSDKMEFDKLSLDATSNEGVDVDTSSLSDVGKMYKIIDLQSFDGSWSLSNKLLQLFGLSQDQVQNLLSGAGDDESVRATALGIAWLKIKVPAEKDVWEMVVDKAEGWIQAKIGSDKAKEVIEAAVKIC